MVRPLLANFHLQLNSAHANVHSAGFHSGVFHRAVSMPSVTESLANDWGKSSDPAERARQLVALMSKSLMKDLSTAGFKAVRQPPGAPLPAQGWLLRGSFSLVQEGNRLQRSIVGMGMGQTDIKVLTCVNDLSQGLPRPLWEIDTDANSGNKVGGGATLAFGPYGAAVAFVRAGQDVEKNVKQTASGIASQVTQHIQKTTAASHQ